jgi:hypothetical protein
MRRRMLIAVGLGTIVLAGAALAPPWVGSLGRQPVPVAATVVPFELAGLYVTDCDLERSIHPQPASCAGLYRVGGLTASPAFDPFHRAMYYGYLASELVPCLREHGFMAELPSRDAMRAIDISGWYLTIVLQDEAEFGRAIDAWYECPLIPSYLEDSARDGLGVVE